MNKDSSSDTRAASPAKFRQPSSASVGSDTKTRSRKSSTSNSRTFTSPKTTKTGSSPPGGRRKSSNYTRDSSKSRRKSSMSVSSIGTSSASPKRLAQLLVNVEEEKRKLQEERELRRLRLLEGIKTRLIVIDLNGSKKETIVEKIIESFFDLQFEVSKCISLKHLCMIEYDDGSMVRPESFRVDPVYKIRELPSHRISKLQFYPQLDIRWEYTTYVGRPKDWVDKYEERKSMKLKEIEDKFETIPEAEKIIDKLIKENS